jgi:Xaa-Pro aminopeptidase
VHGIGIEEHEDPYIVEGNTEALRAGHAFSVEPGVYVPGRFGIRIEDLALVTGSDARVMTSIPKELVTVR